MREHRARLAVVAAALALAMMTASSSALADDEVDATSLRVEQLADDAFARAGRGAYKEALALYLQANDAAPSAALAFNIAWLYDKQLGAPALALDYYRRALAAPDVTRDLSARAEERIAALDGLATLSYSATDHRPQSSARVYVLGASGKLEQVGQPISIALQSEWLGW